MRPSEIDGLAVGSFSLEPDRAIDLAWKLGLEISFLMEDDHGGAASLNMIAHAARAVEAGDASAVLVVAGDHLSRGDFTKLIERFNAATSDYLAPLGYGGPNTLFAMLTKRHMSEHDLDRKDYGTLVVTQRAWAAGNPAAAYRTPLTLNEYLEAPLVADPLCLFDCPPVVAGANAVVIAPAERVRSPIQIRAVRGLHNPDHQEGDGLSTGLARIAPELWNEVGFGPDEVDVASIYDDYPAMVLVQLADLGFAPGGDIKRLVHDRIARRELPLNTSGGQLSAGQAGVAGGMHGVVEMVRQLRGKARGRQVERAGMALVTGYGMVTYRYGACANAMVLQR